MSQPTGDAFAGKRILVGICGGIAAYKCANIVSALRQVGADVHVIMTESAQRFVTPLTFRALSDNDVHTDMFADTAAWRVAHITLVRECDAMLVLNATANTLAKLAHGIADNLLTTCVLATRRPVIVAHAMNTAMLEHPATQANIATLQDRGLQFVAPGCGFLACGEVGDGRLADEDDVLGATRRVLERSRELAGARVVVTAGPTREFLDPARFLSNPSTGRMGYAMASEAASRGGDVVLVSGPTEVRPPAGCELVRVTTAREMHAAVMERLAGTSLFVGAAAVADFRPVDFSSAKVKKYDAPDSVALARNPDIIADVAAHRPDGCFVLGFAAETDALEDSAREKLARKKLDCIVVNRIGDGRYGFADVRNEVVILWRDGREAVPPAGKDVVAAAIFDRVSRLRNRR